MIGLTTNEEPFMNESLFQHGEPDCLALERFSTLPSYFIVVQS